MKDKKILNFFDIITYIILIQQTSYKEDLQHQEIAAATSKMVMEFILPVRWRRGFKNEAYAKAEGPHKQA
jgi:hypothetical protein